MSLKPLVKDYMIESYRVLPDDLRVAEAKRRLPKNMFGIVVDQEAAPISLVRLERLSLDIAQEQKVLRSTEVLLPPVVVTSCEADMHMLALPRVSSLFDRGALGAVVLGTKQEIVGVLPSAKMKDFLASAAYNPAKFTQVSSPPSGPGYAGLGGKVRGIPAIKVKCVTCGYVNSLAFLDPNKLPRCQNKTKTIKPHKLKLT